MPNTYKGGNAPGYATSTKPTLGFAVKAEHGYLGHFKQEAFLRMGHNTVASARRPKMSTPFTPPPATPVLEPGGGLRTPAPGKSRIDALSGRKARRVLKAASLGDTPTSAPYAAAVRRERPVLAAKVDRRTAVQKAKIQRKAAIKAGTPAAINAATGAVKAARTAGRSAVQAARKDPNSARSERKARRAAY